MDQIIEFYSSAAGRVWQELTSRQTETPQSGGQLCNVQAEVKWKDTTRECCGINLVDGQIGDRRLDTWLGQNKDDKDMETFFHASYFNKKRVCERKCLH